MFLFFAIKKNHKESSKEKKEKTCNRFLCPSGILGFGFAKSLSRPIVAFSNTVEVTMRTITHRSRAALGSDRLRKSAGYACNSHLILCSLEHWKHLRVSLLLWFSFFLSLHRKQREEEMNIKSTFDSFLQRTIKFDELIYLFYFRLNNI